MKRLLSSITLLLAVSLCFSVKAQSLEEQLRIADSLKVQYGETDSRYLDALSKAVPLAFNEGAIDTAIELRHRHSEIIKKVFGEKSFEYAEDLWRLGNIADSLSFNYQVDCYKKAETIIKKKKLEETYLYCNIQWRLFFLYQKDNKWELAIESLKKYLEYAPKCLNKEWKGNELNHIDIANAYFFLGYSYVFAFNDIKTALPFYKECILYLEKQQLLLEYPYSLAVLEAIAMYYADTNDYETSLAWRERCSETMKLIEGDTSMEYINELAKLWYCYYQLSDFDNQIVVNKRIIEQLEKYDKKNSKDPIWDKLYIEEQLSLYKCYVRANKIQDAVNQLALILNIYKLRGESENETYWEYLGKLYFSLIQVSDYESAIAISDEFDFLCKKYVIQDPDVYYNFLISQAEIYALLGEKEMHSKIIERIDNFMVEYAGENVEYRTLYKAYLSSQLYLLGDREGALGLASYCKETIDSGSIKFKSSDDSLHYVGITNLTLGQLLSEDAPEKAEIYLKDAVQNYISLNKSVAPPYSALGILYYNKRDFSNALFYFNRVKHELEKYQRSQSLDYISTLCNIGICYRELGYSNQTISTLDYAESFVRAHFGEQSSILASIYENKAIFYSDICNYELAIENAQKACELTEDIFGRDAEEYWHSIITLASMNSCLGKHEEAIKNYQEAAIFFDNTKDCLFSLINLLIEYSEVQDWNNFEKTSEHCNNIISALQLENTDLNAYYHNIIGETLAEKNNLEALSHYEFAMNILKENNKLLSEDYLEIRTKHAALEIKNGAIRESFIPELLDEYKRLYYDNAVYFNSAERETYMTMQESSSLKDVLFSSRQTGKYDKELYDYLVFYKGLLLGTSRSYYNAVLLSHNEVLLDKYREMNRIRRGLNGELGLLGENSSMDVLNNKANLLEHEITDYLKSKGDIVMGLDITSADIAKVLKKNEVVVEFASYFDYTENTSFYAALLIHGGSEKVSYYRLGKEEEILANISFAPNVLYGRTPASENVYQSLLEPFLKDLGTVRTIYYSPAGVLNRIAIEYLYDGNNYVGEKFHFIRLSSSREMVNIRNEVKPVSTVLYGGINYDEDDETMVAESRKVRGDSLSTNVAFRGSSNMPFRKGWDYLPGTLSEVMQLSDIIRKKKLYYRLLKAEAANEESFKSLTGKNTSIIHLATHGFYYPEENTDRKTPYYIMSPIGVEKISNRNFALRRTGLILAGGNKVWRGENVPNGVEDGVLTALEISSLDLSGCEIAVLSACETGLGDITDEGVWGLQRALKLAGVNTIIMSLWEVDDQATVLMMNEFYENYLKGKGKRQSFNLATKKVKKEYQDPRYWAAFIMLD